MGGRCAAEGGPILARVDQIRRVKLVEQLADFTQHRIEEAGHAYQRRGDLARYPAGDLSRIDWMVTRDLALGHPGLDATALAQAMREGSPQLEERKRGHVQDYIARTTSRALQDPDVVQAWTRARSQEHDHGR
jgi:hypothetical protein